jgi:hypothetical protein
MVEATSADAILTSPDLVLRFVDTAGLVRLRLTSRRFTDRLLDQVATERLRGSVVPAGRQPFDFLCDLALGRVDPAALVANQTYVLLAAGWRGGRINNASLLENPGMPHTSQLRDVVDGHGLHHGEDYEILTENAWVHLQGVYGGGPLIRRPAYEVTTWSSSLGAFIEAVQLELGLLNLKWFLHPFEHAMQPLVVPLTKVDSVGAAKKLVCEALGLDASKVRLWDYYKLGRYALLHDETRSLEDAKIYMHQDMLIEVQRADGSWALAEHTEDPW